jgi:peptidoglycan hydrolase-like protein with peptidoglycan-binding domain
MLPLVINNNLDRLVQVSMSGAAGLGGRNAIDDVILIQSLLNAISPGEGGPQPKLKVDGIAGPLTIGAIRRYQKARTHIVDGRVDPHGPTIKSLVTTLNDRGALPAGLPNTTLAVQVRWNRR